MKDLRLQKNYSRFNWINISAFFKKKWPYITIAVILLIIIIFPTWSGQIIGTWWHNFVGTLVKYARF